MTFLGGVSVGVLTFTSNNVCKLTIHDVGDILYFILQKKTKPRFTFPFCKTIWIDP